MRIELKDSYGQVIYVGELEPKTFKTGSRGHFVNGKVTIDGKRYQLQCQLVEIGSKGR